MGTNDLEKLLDGGAKGYTEPANNNVNSNDAPEQQSIRTKMKSVEDSIDIPEYIARKSARINAAKPFNYTLDDSDKVKELFDEIVDNAELQDMRYASEIKMSKGENCRWVPSLQDGKPVWIETTDDTRNQIARAGRKIVAATLWNVYVYDNREYHVRSQWDSKRVHRTVSFTDGDTQTEVLASDFQTEIPKELGLKEEWVHDLGYVPVIEWFNYSTNTFDAYDLRDVYSDNLQTIIDNNFIGLNYELSMDLSIMVLDKSFLSNYDAETQKAIQAMVEMALVTKGETNGDDPKAPKAIEYIQTNIKIEERFNVLKGSIELALDAAGYSPTADSSANSATQVIFQRAGDMETTNAKLPVRENTMKRVLEITRDLDNSSLCHNAGLYSEKGKISVEYVKNIIDDEAHLTEIMVKQLDAGLRDEVSAVMRLEGISFEAAEEQVKKGQESKEARQDKEMEMNDIGQEDQSSAPKGTEKEE